MGRDLMAGGGVSPAPEEIPAIETDNVATKKAKSIIPGFRFHPTDEELVSYYLKRKVLNKPYFDAIEEVDIYKHHPWELSEYSKLKTRDQEWYFFSALNRVGTRMSRLTNGGYWKATGKDREIRGGRGDKHDELIGMKKFFVFHTGRAPNGVRTNWVIHEYHLLQQSMYALCKLFCKKKIGASSNLNRYAAPFLEQEWEVPEALLHVKDRVVDANGSKQENQKQRKYLIDINELPREFEMDDNSEHDESLNRESVVVDLPPCFMNTQAPLPFIDYKRKRENGNSENSSGTTSTNITSSATKTDTAIAELFEFSVLDCSHDDKKKNLLLKEKEAEPVDTVLHAASSSPTKLINNLQEEKRKIIVKREKLEREIKNADTMIRSLQMRISALSEEKEELKKNSSSNKGQRS